MRAVVTGANRGIGFAILKRIVALGYDAIAIARKVSCELQELIDESNGKVEFLSCDISKIEDRAKFESYISKFDSIDLLVNCAGVAPKVRKDILEINEDDFDYVLDINQKGTFFMSQIVAKKMLEKNMGRIVNISSISSYTASINRAEYCISKASISMMTKLFAARLSTCGIGVFEVMPGIIETDMTSKVKDKYDKLIKDGLTLIDRMGNVDDVAKCVEAIANGLLDFCTGTAINADGGFSVRRL